MAHYKDFRIGDLFEKLDISPLPNGVRQKLAVKDKDALHNIPLTAAKLGDSGIMYWGNSKDFATARKCIAMVYDGAVSAGSVYPHEGPVGIYSHSYLIKPFADVSFQAITYMATAMQKVIYPKYSRDRPSRWDKVCNDLICLPVDCDGNPDYAYMTKCIKELETECIKKLETFLITTKLKDCKLNEEDINALSCSVAKGEFRVGVLFDGQTGDVDLQAKDIDGMGEYLVNSGVQNQGIKGKTSRPARIFPSSTITVDFLGNSYLRDFEFKMATHNHVFALIERCAISHDAKLYIVATLNKLSAAHSFNNMLTWTELKDVIIQLPIAPSGEPDFDFMATYIRAMQKLVIADAVKLKNNFDEGKRI